MPPKQLKGSHSSSNPHRKAENVGQRSKNTIQRLNMYNAGKPIRNKKGTVVGGQFMMDTKAGNQKITAATGRIAPDRRWFGNTRTISSNELEKFKDDMTTKSADPYSVVLRRKKIPMALLQDSKKIAKVNLLETESFDQTFGGKTKRKRPKLDQEAHNDYSTILQNAEVRGNLYEQNSSKDTNIEVAPTRGGEMIKDDLFSKGQSKRIWAELYKVLDSSDVILQVVDARNVPGTRCHHIENHIKKNASHKHLVILINKCDLVPGWVTRKWVKILSAEFPTLAFHASITNAFGKGALISLLRQYAKLHSDKRQISVGIIGYPNTGKSSVINALMAKKCCKAAPIPGETKVWQYITLTRRIFLIDCPGVVYDVGDNEIETVLKGAVRSERLEAPQDFIPEILSRVQKKYVERHYSLRDWTDCTDFLTQLAIQMGKLIKGGEPDLNNVAIQVINDFQRGKLPYFIAPPRANGDPADAPATRTKENEEQDNEDEEDDTPLIAPDEEEEEDEGDSEGRVEELEDSEDDDEEEEEEETAGPEVEEEREVAVEEVRFGFQPHLELLEQSVGIPIHRSVRSHSKHEPGDLNGREGAEWNLDRFHEQVDPSSRRLRDPEDDVGKAVK